MHLAVFFQYYHNPDCAATAKHFTLLHHWAEHHRVTLVTSNRWRSRRLTERFPWVPDNVRLVELDVPYDNRMPTFQRGVVFWRYAWKALRAGRYLDAPDVLFGTSTPLSVAWTTARLARHYGVPWVFEVRDLWPDFPIEMEAVPPLLRPPLRALEAQLYREADHVVAFSPGMEAHLARHGHAHKTTLLYNGTDLPLVEAARSADLRALRERYDLGQRRVLLYAGSFGRANNLPLMLEAARHLAHRDDHVFVFTGDGYDERSIRQAAEALPNVRLVPPQPRHAVFDWFHLADLALVTFLPLPVLGANSPSKLFDALACGTPIVVTNAGWMQRLVETGGMGWYAPADDAAGYAQTLAHVLDHPEALATAAAAAHAYAHRPENTLMFDRDAQAHRYLEIFEQVVASRGAQR